jgi:hypothetical protein
MEDLTTTLRRVSITRAAVAKYLPGFPASLLAAGKYLKIVLKYLACPPATLSAAA